MTVTARLSRSLHHTLGDEAAEDLVNWMHHMDANRDELREICELYFSRTDSRLDARLADFRIDLSGIREELRVGLARMDAKLEQRFGDLIKWSFVFWVGAVAAIAALAKVLR